VDYVEGDVKSVDGSFDSPITTTALSPRTLCDRSGRVACPTVKKVLRADQVDDGPSRTSSGRVKVLP